MAGEGCFRSSPRRETFADGSERRRFVFELSMATEDRALLERLQVVLGAGTIQDRGRRRSHWKPESRLTIASEATHVEVTIPFFDRFLAPGQKRRQFDAWRRDLVQYRERRSELRPGPSACGRPGCDLPVRGRGLCRRHYYEATGW